MKDDENIINDKVIPQTDLYKKNSFPTKKSNEQYIENDKSNEIIDEKILLLISVFHKYYVKFPKQATELEHFNNSKAIIEDLRKIDISNKSIKKILGMASIDDYEILKYILFYNTIINLKASSENLDTYIINYESLLNMLDNFYIKLKNSEIKINKNSYKKIIGMCELTYDERNNINSNKKNSDKLIFNNGKNEEIIEEKKEKELLNKVDINNKNENRINNKDNNNEKIIKEKEFNNKLNEFDINKNGKDKNQNDDNNKELSFKNLNDDNNKELSSKNQNNENNKELLNEKIKNKLDKVDINNKKKENEINKNDDKNNNEELIEGKDDKLTEDKIENLNNKTENEINKNNSQELIIKNKSKNKTKKSNLNKLKKIENNNINKEKNEKDHNNYKKNNNNENNILENNDENKIRNYDKNKENNKVNDKQKYNEENTENNNIVNSENLNLKNNEKNKENNNEKFENFNETNNKIYYDKIINDFNKDKIEKKNENNNINNILNKNLRDNESDIHNNEKNFEKNNKKNDEMNNKNNNEDYIKNNNSRNNKEKKKEKNNETNNINDIINNFSDDNSNDTIGNKINGKNKENDNKINSEFNNGNNIENNNNEIMKKNKSKNKLRRISKNKVLNNKNSNQDLNGKLKNKNNNINSVKYNIYNSKLKNYNDLLDSLENDEDEDIFGRSYDFLKIPRLNKIKNGYMEQDDLSDKYNNNESKNESIAENNFKKKKQNKKRKEKGNSSIKLKSKNDKKIIYEITHANSVEYLGTFDLLNQNKEIKTKNELIYPFNGFTRTTSFAIESPEKQKINNDDYCYYPFILRKTPQLENKTIYLSGSLPKLGSWDPLRAIKMDEEKRNGEEFFSKYLEVEKKEIPFEYKFLFYDDDGKINWIGLPFENYLTFPQYFENLKQLKKSHISIINLNIRYINTIDGINIWDNRKNRLIELLVNKKADIFFFQEITHPQSDFIDKYLSSIYEFVGEYRDSTDKAEKCSICVNKLKYTIIHSGQFWLSSTPYVPGSNDFGNFFPRICTWASLKQIEGISLLFMNVHLDHENKKAHLPCVKVLLEEERKIENRFRDIHFVFIAGCFYCEEYDEEIKYIRNQGYTEIMFENTYHAFTGIAKNHWDYMFWKEKNGNDIEFKEAHVMKKEGTINESRNHYISDHYPIYAEFFLKNLKKV